jgi:hypothetical protein
MKKEVTILALLLVLTIPGFTTASCDLDVSLINQDPYPVIPGEYVKLVFQLEGTDSPDCDDITFNLLEKYPLEFDPGELGSRTFRKIDYVKDYDSNILVPYEVRINEDALDGSNSIDVQVQSKNDAPLLKTLDIEIDDVRADFEVYVKDYSYTTNEITIEVLNIEKSDIEALTIEIPKQDAIEIKGSNRVVVGDLDSNEYTSADFEASLSDGDFKVNLIYSDTINNRRIIEKVVSFDSSYFTDKKADQVTLSSKITSAAIGIIFLIIGLIIAVIVIKWLIKKAFGKKK